uniref:Uncharacterized protein n=1 Tax=Aegilops tauschii subsp. strangulata TaxID=200361 RepID=A0A453EE88_AEGTS
MKLLCILTVVLALASVEPAVSSSPRRYENPSSPSATPSPTPETPSSSWRRNRASTLRCSLPTA